MRINEEFLDDIKGDDLVVQSQSQVDPQGYDIDIYIELANNYINRDFFSMRTIKMLKVILQLFPKFVSLQFVRGTTVITIFFVQSISIR